MHGAETHSSQGTAHIRVETRPGVKGVNLALHRFVSGSVGDLRIKSLEPVNKVRSGTQQFRHVK